MYRTPATPRANVLATAPSTLPRARPRARLGTLLLLVAGLALGPPAALAGDALFGAPVSIPTGNYPFVAAYGDLNGDGFQDIVSANWVGSGISVLLSTGNISFLPPDTYEVPFSVGFVSTADINEDGWPDIVAPIYNTGQIVFFHNNGDGTFRRQPDMGVGGNPSCTALADLNADGHLDLAVTDDALSAGPHLHLYAGNGSGEFSPMTTLFTSCGANRVLVDDFDLNGKPDLAVSSYFTCGPALSVHLQDAFGSFGSTIYPFAPIGGSYGIVSADLNGDTYPDLATTADGVGKARVVLNQGDGTFGPAALYGTDRAGNDGTLSVVAADFDQDGDQDLVLANRAYDSVTPLLGNGDGTFTVGTDYFMGDGPAYLITADIDNDTRPDLLTPIESAHSVAILFGNGDGSFANEPLPATLGRPRDLAIADFDLDGFKDIFVACDGGASGTLLRNLGTGQTYSSSFVFDNFVANEVEAAYLDGDAYPDVILANYFSITALRNLHPGFAMSQTIYSFDGTVYGLAAGDLNGDARPDIAVTRYAYARRQYVATVYLATGPGTFQTTGADFDLGKGAIFLRLVDLNGDGKLDVVAANLTDGTVTVLSGKGDGTFKGKSSYGTGKGPLSVAAADLNGDGKVDLVAGNVRENTLAVLLGTPGGLKSRVKYDTWPSARSVQLADFDGDGRLDASAISFESDMATIHLGNGNGTLGARGNYAVGNGAMTSGAGDLNNDGWMDLVVGNYSNQNVSILLNTGSGTLVPAATFTGSPELASTAPRPAEHAGASEIQVSPNPLNPEATFSFTMTGTGRVRIGLYDVQGRLVRTVMDEPSVAPGRHSVRIDGRTDQGSPLATGVYFWRLDAAEESRTGRLTVTK